MSQIRSFRDLRVWQHGMALVEYSYRLTQSFPDTERFALAQQLRKAAVSIPANVAEGHARKRTQAYLNHISIALGSLAELETLVETARRLTYISPTAAADFIALSDPLGRQLSGLAHSLERHRAATWFCAIALLYFVGTLMAAKVY